MRRRDTKRRETNMVQRGNIWYLRIQIKGRDRLKSTGFSDWESAKRKASEMKSDLLAEKAGWRAPAPTVAEWWAVYQKTYTARKRAPKRDHQIIGPFVAKFGARPMDEITKADCIGWLNERVAKGCAAGTIERDHGGLMAFFNRALDNDKIAANPWKGIKKVRGVARDRVLTLDEQAKLMSTLRPDYQRLVTVLLGTGLREAELLQLKPGDIRGDQLIVRSEGAKFGKARTVPLRPEVKRALLTQREMSVDPDAFWTQDPSSLRQCVKEACERAKIPHTTIHDLRRTFATRCAVAGMPPKVLQEILGHASIDVTMKHYAHIRHTDQQQWLGKVALGIEELGTP